MKMSPLSYETKKLFKIPGLRLVIAVVDETHRRTNILSSANSSAIKVEAADLSNVFRPINFVEDYRRATKIGLFQRATGGHTSSRIITQARVDASVPIERKRGLAG